MQFSATDLINAERAGVDVSKVKVGYTWIPSWQNVYVGNGIKTTLSHSLWVGLVMTVLNLPSLFWSLLLGPILMILWRGSLSFAAYIFGTVLGAIRGNVAGIMVDAESFVETVNQENAKRFQAMIAAAAAQGMLQVVSDPSPDAGKTEAPAQAQQSTGQPGDTPAA
jgi:hypothetical protein